MSLLDYYIASKITAAPTTKVPVDLDAATLPKEKKTTFPSAPADVYHKKAPPQMKEEIDARPFEDQNQLEQDVSYEGEYIALLAKTLREFDEGKLALLKQKQRKAIEKLKQSFGYSEKTKELEIAVQAFGDKILSLMGQSNDTIRVLARMQENWVYLSKEFKTTEVKPDEYTALLQSLKENLGEATVKKVMSRAEQIIQEGTQALVSLDTRLTVAPIRQDYHTKKDPSVVSSVKKILAEVEDELVGQFKSVIQNMTAFESLLVQIETEITDVIGHGNVTNVDFSNNMEQNVAASKK